MSQGIGEDERDDKVGKENGKANGGDDGPRFRLGFQILAEKERLDEIRGNERQNTENEERLQGNVSAEIHKSARIIPKAIACNGEKRPSANVFDHARDQHRPEKDERGILVELMKYQIQNDYAETIER